MTSEDNIVPMASIPSIDRILKSKEMRASIEIYGRQIITTVLRYIVAELRAQGVAGQDISAEITISAIAKQTETRLGELTASKLKPALNLTGTVLHTNLGRAPLPIDAIEAMVCIAGQASSLEYNLVKGKRGDRDEHIAGLVCQLTGAEAACAVNNNAAAVLLVLNTLALGRNVLVSRGELVEIGGSFRIPDIMERAGVELREVGTTNRTHIKDFDGAINPNTALIMKVHTSNFEIRGFTATVPEPELAALAHRHHVPFVVDLGSGSLVDLSTYDLPNEQTIGDTLAQGADIVTFSGDKLLGGPQAGLIAGRADIIEKINANPMKRAMRLDKITLAALGAVLRLYLDPENLVHRLPALRLLCRPYGDIKEMAGTIQPAVSKALNGIAAVQVIDCKSQIGSGALPTDLLDSSGLSITPVDAGDIQKDGKSVDLAIISEAFRSLAMPVIGKMSNGRLVFDLRCLETPDELIDQLPELRKLLEQLL